jgi:chemotaxis protein CheY-P-specific phosphatase CheC
MGRIKVSAGKNLSANDALLELGNILAGSFIDVKDKHFLFRTLRPIIRKGNYG